MDRIELRRLADSIRRQTTNSAVLSLCDGVLELLAVRVEPPVPKQEGKFDKVKYQRDYMRRYRAKKILKK